MANLPPTEPRSSSKLNLEDVLLDNVEITSEPLGSLGTYAYGKISEAYYYGSLCVAKEFNCSWASSIFAFDSRGNPNLKSKPTREFMKECLQCTKLRHPNVVQFFGVYHKKSSGTQCTWTMPVLIIEKVGDTLKKFLSESRGAEMSCKLSILLDIAQGLMYLHSRNPTIVHGGITSGDVLLTNSPRPQAKISGDPKVFYSLKPAWPGGNKPHNKDLIEFLPYRTYGDCLDMSLDVFSYGGIMLHTLTEEWPKPLFMDSHSVGKSNGRGKSTIEIDRRLTYIKKVNHHILEGLIRSCLDDNAKTRPSITVLHKGIINVINHQEPTPVCAAAKNSTLLAEGVQKDKASKTKQNNEQVDQESQQKDKEIEQEKHTIMQQKENEKIEVKSEEIQKIIVQKNNEIEQIRNKLQEAEEQIKVQQENLKRMSASQHGNAQSQLQHTGTQTEDEKIDEEVKEIIKSQHMKNNNEQSNNIIGNASRNDGDEKEQRKVKKAKMQSNEQTEQKEKPVDLLPATDMCKIDIPNKPVIINETVSATVTLRNAQGKPIVHCDRCIQVFIKPNEHQSSAITLPTKFTELSNGQYTVTFAITEAGNYELHMYVDSQKIIGSPLWIQCVEYHYPQQVEKVPELCSQMRVIKPLRNSTNTKCYTNSVLQVLNQTTGVIEMMSKHSKERSYKLPYKNEADNVNMKLPITLSGFNQNTLVFQLYKFLNQVEFDTSRFIEPDYVLQQLTENSRQQRFSQHTQEDSHELLRYLLYELKKEETDLIKDQVYECFGTTAEYSSYPNITNQDKQIIKSLLRTASKVNNTPIDGVFGGEKLNIVICRECQTPLQSKEPFFDISLGVPCMKQRTSLVYGGGRGRGYPRESSNPHDPHWQYNTKQFTSSNGNSAHGNRRGVGEKPKVPRIYDKMSVQKLLVSKKMFYQPVPDKIASDIDALDDVQTSLADHTEVDNMDENNKFICKNCMEKEGTVTGDTSGDKIKLSFVTKQILIHRLPQALIIHFKRFDIGTYSVTKNSYHVSFSPILNMAPYCSNECLEIFSDTKGEILYGLYGVIEHMGHSLQSGHYVAHVRKRPERQNKFNSKPKEPWIYDSQAAYDGKWFSTSDLRVRECMWGFEIVKQCKAYMLFYELLPWKPYGTGV